MAQNARVSSLTDELIQSILKFDPATNRQAYKHAKEIASRGLRGHQYGRTNQFDVTAAFAGLDEKFRIKSRDDLADALHLRLQKLENVTSKFKPDFLALLLQLADRPLENTHVEALDLLHPPSPPPPLTWDEILRDDPYSDDDIWKDINYANDSSADEETVKIKAKKKSTLPSSAEQDDTFDPETCVLQFPQDLVTTLESAQFWNTIADDDNRKIEITELQAVRETLFMLGGLRTSLYQIDQQQQTVRLNSKYLLSHAMSSTVDHLLLQFTDTGRQIYRLRQWTNKESDLSLIQTFEAAVRARLSSYDQLLAKLQRHYLTPNAPIAVSLLELQNSVQTLSIPILRLAQIVADIEPQLLVDPFVHLEALFNEATLAQMTLEGEIFKYMATMFLECLQTYLKPIRAWMEAGELGIDDETFFVFTSDASSDVASLWHDRYVLRRDGQEKLRSPTFLQPAAVKIFNTGKSVVFLKELGKRSADSAVFKTEPRLDYSTVCGTLNDIPLAPFPELFQAAFESWIRSKYSVAASVLRQHMFDSGGLIRTLVAFQTLYLGMNGAVFEDFSNAVFERMDSKKRGWSDRYVLSELARSIFGSVMPISDLDRIVVRPTKVKSKPNSVVGLATVLIDYALPWPIQNIIQRSSASTYQQLFTFLLQIYRVKYLLKRSRPTRIGSSRHRQTTVIIKLQHRLTWFVDILRSFLTETVIFFTAQDMETSMQKAEDIDEMSRIHITFIANLHQRAMLGPELKPIYKAIMETLDLGVLYAETLTKSRDGDEPKPASKSKTSSSRRKSVVPVLQIVESSDSDEHMNEETSPSSKVSENKKGHETLAEVLELVDKDFARLLHFVTAGLKSVGRAGGEPMWEQLAEKLDWDRKKDRMGGY